MAAKPPLHVVILAAGQGTRMRSALPKVLHPVAGRPMLAHVIDTARNLAPQAIHLVHGHGGATLQQVIRDDDLHWVAQEQQLGTGHAVRQALPGIPDDAMVLVLYGDVPLVREATLQPLCEAATETVAVLTVELVDPTGYGRIQRGPEGAVVGIVEEKDATLEQRRITETNTGMMAAPAALLHTLLARCTNDNAQGEYYLTDVVALRAGDGGTVNAVRASDALEVAGVNNRVQLATCERALQQRIAESLMRNGVTIVDPARLDVRGKLHCATDVTIDINCIFEGNVEIGAGSVIGAGAVLRDCRLGENVHVEPYSLIDGATVAADAHIGPFARLRPGTVLEQGAKAGNFVELKKASLGRGTKVNHLSYVGDAVLGAGVNVGAGTITCNYDGTNKHETRIGDGSFIGSDTQLVAPVTVGAGCVVAAGTTVTRDAPDHCLVISRTEQANIEGWPQRRDTKKRD